jgi:hypothetical protein
METMTRTLCLLLVLASPARAAILGSDGINSAGLGLDGSGVWLGQIEDLRAGKQGYDRTYFIPGTMPAEVYAYGATPGDEAGLDSFVGPHATYVAEQMIGMDIAAPGVAPKANLASLSMPNMANDDDATALGLYQLATLHGPSTTINMSYDVNLGLAGVMDGSSFLAQVFDWNASNSDTLFTIAWGNADSFIYRTPNDSFNGIKVAGSQPIPFHSAYTDFWTGNSGLFDGSNGTPFRPGDSSDRTLIEILAPATGIPSPDFQAPHLPLPLPPGLQGTSYAAPMVAGASALMRQYGKRQFDAGNPLFLSNDFQRHEVLKAALLNAADKISGINGATHTACGIGSNASYCRDYMHGDGYGGLNKVYSLDSELGSGLLNTKRAVNQIAAGEYHSSGSIPSLGWDYNTIGGDGDSVTYNFANSLTAGKYLTATLAWDRITNVDGNTSKVWQYGSTFTPYSSVSDVLNDLDLWLLAADGTPVASSTTTEDNVEQIFWPIPSDGMYKLVVTHATDTVGSSQSYALAWWFGDGFANAPVLPADYNNDNTVGPADYTVWKNSYGSPTDLAADGNGDGIVDAADYTVWRDHLGQHAGSGSAVPEPATVILLGIAGILIGVRSRCGRLFATCESLSLC